MHDLWILLFKNHFWQKNYFHTAEMNLTTRAPLYTCLVMFLLRERVKIDLFSFILLKRSSQTLPQHFWHYNHLIADVFWQFRSNTICFLTPSKSDERGGEVCWGLKSCSFFLKFCVKNNITFFATFWHFCDALPHFCDKFW